MLRPSQRCYPLIEPRMFEDDAAHQSLAWVSKEKKKRLASSTLLADISPYSRLFVYVFSPQIDPCDLVRVWLQNPELRQALVFAPRSEFGLLLFVEN